MQWERKSSVDFAGSATQQNTILQVSCVGCRCEGTSSSSGTINFEKAGSITFSNVNVASCYATLQGSAINAGSTESGYVSGATFSGLYLTIVSNSGQTILDHSNLNFIPRIECCNFRNNQASLGVCSGS
jgi:hypothetical protein